jgi:hypothetical protein
MKICGMPQKLTETLLGMKQVIWLIIIHLVGKPSLTLGLVQQLRVLMVLLMIPQDGESLI